MSTIEFDDEDLKGLIHCINNGMEPPPELAKKLFPSLFTSFDFKTLRDARIPTIEYQGKRSVAAILGEAAHFGENSPLQLERFFEGGKLRKAAKQLSLFSNADSPQDDDWKNLIVQGDNLQFLKKQSALQLQYMQHRKE